MEVERKTRVIISNDEGTNKIGVLDPAYFAIPNLTNVDRKKSEKSFVFDTVLWSVSPRPDYSTQADVYDKCGKQAVKYCFEGFSCSILAYGQTGSGKTFTMLGSNDRVTALRNLEDDGIVPRLCKEVVDEAQTRGSRGDDRFVGNVSTNRIDVHVTYYEIYNERVYDLLSESTSALRVREHPTDGAYAESLTKVEVTSYNDIVQLLKRGEKRRAVGSTLQNIVSSRSHAVFTLHVTQQCKCTDGLQTHEMQRKGKVNLVDLAGSERASLTGASGARLREANNINRSLSALGDVIISLSSRPDVDGALSPVSSSSGFTNNSANFVPYRNSVLTWLLRDSLGGNSKCTVSIEMVVISSGC
jgi:hypothetical protein